MGKANFSDDFKRDAVRQITERGQSVTNTAVMPATPPEVFHSKHVLLQRALSNILGCEVRSTKERVLRIA